MAAVIEAIIELMMHGSSAVGRATNAQALIVQGRVMRAPPML